MALSDTVRVRNVPISQWSPGVTDWTSGAMNSHSHYNPIEASLSLYYYNPIENINTGDIRGYTNTRTIIKQSN